MMDTELDSNAVEAVKNGDQQRYSELMERHENRVYAIAWSRLGDADLAQEATQEAFLKGYQHLTFLNQGGKFAAWISAIARNMAINVGLRHRNELKKRQRWALEQPNRNATFVEEEDAEVPVSTESLRETLAELPAKHRECLVLFYLEDKSITEAARSLGLSDTAFKTRLFRARAALRQRLEKRLDISLTRLRPRHAVAPIVLGLLTSGKVKAAFVAGSSTGVTTKAAIGVMKLIPFRLLLLGLWFTGLLPGMVLHYYLGKQELKNYRHQDGFRARNFKLGLRRSLYLTPILITLILLVMACIAAYLGEKWILRLFGLFFLYPIYALLGQLKTNRSKYLIYYLCAIGVYTLTFLAVGFLDVPSEGLFCSIAVASIFIGLAERYQPRRMDYNLFLRLIENLIPLPSTVDPQDKLTREEIWAFARFLGKRWLVIKWRPQREGFQFRLPPVRASIMYDGFLPLLWYKASTFTVSFDGHIHVDLGERDRRNLNRLRSNQKIDKNALENHIKQVLQGALQAFLKGDIAEAERVLGQQPEEEIFHVTPQASKAVRWRGRWMVGLGVFMLLLLAWDGWQERQWPLEGPRLKAVQANEDEVRAALDLLSGDPNQNPEAWRSFRDALSSIDFRGFPPREWFPPQTQTNIERYTRNRVASFPLRMPDEPKRVMEAFFVNNYQVLFEFIRKGLWTSTDLNALGLTPAIARRYITEINPLAKRYLERIPEIGVSNRDYTVLHVEEFATYLTLLHYLDCLDLVARKPIIDQISRHQVIAGNSLEGRKPIADRTLLHGLFHMHLYNPLRETYDALLVLSLLDGLEFIDREACIQGILRFHHGKGIFGLNQKNGGLMFRGGTHDTLYAYESLRLLKALDRVKDLHKWVFRPRLTSKRLSRDQVREFTWSEIEAYVLSQRLKEFIEARHQNPHTEAPSLCYP